MKTRAMASLCSLLFAWLFVLVVGEPRHAPRQPLAARGAIELALRDVADGPLLVPRVMAARVTSARPAGRDTSPSHAATPAAHVTRLATVPAMAARTALLRQDDSYRGRARWRAYDAVAPPVHSRFAR